LKKIHRTGRLDEKLREKQGLGLGLRGKKVGTRGKEGEKLAFFDGKKVAGKERPWLKRM